MWQVASYTSTRVLLRKNPWTHRVVDLEGLKGDNWYDILKARVLEELKTSTGQTVQSI